MVGDSLMNRWLWLLLLAVPLFVYAAFDEMNGVSVDDTWTFNGVSGGVSINGAGAVVSGGPTSVVLTAKVAAEYDEGIYINSKLIGYNGGAGTVFATQAVDSAVEYTFLCQELPQLQLDSVSGETSCSVTSDNWTEYGGNIEVTVTNVTPASFTADLSEGGGGA
jgi:hypothetical protein